MSRDRRQIGRQRRVGEPGADDRDPPRRQRVLRQRRDVPARRELHRRADIERPRVGLGDDVESFHASIPSHLTAPIASSCSSTAMYGRLRYFSA